MNGPPPDAWLVSAMQMPQMSQLSFEVVANFFLKSLPQLPQMPFEWRTVDAPDADTVLLVCLDPNARGIPTDGIRYLSSEQAQRVLLPLAPSHPFYQVFGPQLEIETSTVARGYRPPRGSDDLGNPPVPSPDASLCRVRRRYRLSRSMIPQLHLVHWGVETDASLCPAVPAGWDREPIRSYPLPTVPVGQIFPFRNLSLAPARPPVQATPVPQQQTHVQPPVQQMRPQQAAYRPVAPVSRPRTAATAPARAAPAQMPPAADEYESTSDFLDSCTARTFVLQRYKEQHANLAPIFDAWRVPDLLDAFVRAHPSTTVQAVAGVGEKSPSSPSSPPLRSLEDEKQKLRDQLDQLKLEVAEGERTRRDRKMLPLKV